MTDEGYNLTNQWLIINGSEYYSYGMIWLSDLVGGVWLKIVGNLGLIGARLGWALLMGLTGLASFLILKRYFHPLASLLAVLAAALASMYHGTMTINYNNFPALLLIGATGLLLVSQERGPSRKRHAWFAVLGGLLLGLGVMARFPLILSLFLPLVPPAMQAVFVRRIPAKSYWGRALISFAMACLTIVVCLSILYLTHHLAEYLDFLKIAFSQSAESSHNTGYLLHLYYRTGKSAVILGSKLVAYGFALALLVAAASYSIRRALRQASNPRALIVVPVVVGALLLIMAVTVLTPTFIAHHLSPDGILGNDMIQRIHAIRLATLLCGVCIMLLGVVLFMGKLLSHRIEERSGESIPPLWWGISAILFGCLFFSLVEQQAGVRYEYSLALPGICFSLGTVLVLFGVFSRRWLTAERLNRFVLLGMGFSVALLSFIGSNNGISNAKNGLWLLFPAAFLLLPESLGKVLPSILSLAQWTKQKALSDGHKQSITYFAVAAMCAFALVGFHIRAENPYRDLTNRFQLTTRIEHERLRGIFTSSGRAASVNQLLDEIDRLVKPGDIILAYSAIPMIHYVTETLPALGNPWPTLIQPAELEVQLNGLWKSESFPQLVIRTRTNTANRIWGGRAIAPPQAPLRRVEDICILDGWIQEQGYYEVWANRDFVIYKLLSEASSTSNIARSLVDRGCNGE